jgi:hypothetical protein
MNSQAVKEKPVINIHDKTFEEIFQTSPGIDYDYYIFSGDLAEALEIKEDSIPDSFYQGLKDCEEDQTIDLDTALNNPPPRP